MTDNRRDIKTKRQRFEEHPEDFISTKKDECGFSPLILKPPTAQIPVHPEIALYFGYRGNASYVAFFGVPGQGPMWDDGVHTGPAYQKNLTTYLQHPRVAPKLRAYRLGFQGKEADHWLVFSVGEARVYVADRQHAQAILSAQIRIGPDVGRTIADPAARFVPLPDDYFTDECTRDLKSFLDRWPPSETPPEVEVAPTSDSEEQLVFPFLAEDPLYQRQVREERIVTGVTQALEARLSREAEAILKEVLTERLDETVVAVTQQAVRQALNSIQSRLDELTGFAWLVAGRFENLQDPADWWKRRTDEEEDSG